MASFYSGFIWEICYQPYAVVTFVDDGPCTRSRCDNCPEGPVCLIDCEWYQWLDGEICTDCDSDCADGCIREENCNPCFDDTCAFCPAWEDCQECIDNAELNEDFCECSKGFYYEEWTDQCLRCDLRCANCTDDTIWSCEECKEGFYLHRDEAICRPHCPTGYDTDGLTHSCAGDPINVFCLTFDKPDLEWLTAYDVTLRSGHNPGAREDDDPVPIYNRGMWLDGENDCMEFNGLSLNPTFTLEAWVRISEDP